MLIIIVVVSFPSNRPSMGNAIRHIRSEFGKEEEDSGVDLNGSNTQTLGPHGVTTATVGVSALAHDILNFDATSQV